MNDVEGTLNPWLFGPQPKEQLQTTMLPIDRDIDSEEDRKPSAKAKGRTRESMDEYPDEQIEELTDEEKRAKRRRKHTINARIRRAKEKIEIEGLQAQYWSVKSTNQALKQEQRRLKKLLRAAHDATAGLS